MYVKHSILIISAALLLSTVVGCSGDYEDGLQAYNNKDYETAFQLFKSASEQGNTDAQLKLGVSR